MTDAIARAIRFNLECGCTVADVGALQERLDIVSSHPHLFSAAPVFLAREHALRMQRVIAAVGAVTALPAYREEVLARSPLIARSAPRCHGVFFGYDFHIAEDGPKLIEINTNAGGALLNIELRRARQPCCQPSPDCRRDEPDAPSLEVAVVDMFMNEWRLARDTGAPETIAIVDESPRSQYLYPEFLLVQALFAARGIRTLIVDASELVIDSDSLTARGQRIDLVYNRSTDFYFTQPTHAALAEAYVRDLAVITPHPHAHALLANKHNLATLSDAGSLRAMHAAPADIESLTEAIPPTRLVSHPEPLDWGDRKQWFFKPASGFGSRGAYRGDKITRRVFGDVLRGDYIAQRIAPPSERRLACSQESFKLDIRSYVYDGVTQLQAARLYQGQTTNFRSAGGGFAHVHLLDDTPLC